MSDDVKVKVRGLTKKFGDLLVLDNISFDIKKGDFVCIVGPTGCGKTTFLNLLVKLLEPTSGQILIDKTRLTPAKILTAYVVAGVILGGVGIYEKLVEFAGAGATIPLTGFGNNLAMGVREAIKQDGFLGIFTGGLKAAAGGITVAVSADLLASVVFRPKDKS